MVYMKIKIIKPVLIFILLFWIVLNSVILLKKPFDPYPYILLNLVLSCIAALQAPVIIAVVLERANFTSAIGSTIKQKDYTMIDIGIAVENICLQATELGLGSCIVGWFNEHKVKKILQIPRTKRVPLLITLGYSDDIQRTKIRKKIEEIYSFNKY